MLKRTNMVWFQLYWRVYCSLIEKIRTDIPQGLYCICASSSQTLQIFYPNKNTSLLKGSAFAAGRFFGPKKKVLMRSENKLNLAPKSPNWQRWKSNCHLLSLVIPKTCKLHIHALSLENSLTLTVAPFSGLYSNSSTTHNGGNPEFLPPSADTCSRYPGLEGNFDANSPMSSLTSTGSLREQWVWDQSKFFYERSHLCVYSCRKQSPLETGHYLQLIETSGLLMGSNSST